MLLKNKVINNFIMPSISESCLEAEIFSTYGQMVSEVQ